MNKNIIILIIILVAAAVGWFGNLQFRNQEERYTGPVEDVIVRLKWLHHSSNAGMYVAKEKGWYEDAGLDVTLKEFKFGGISSIDELDSNLVDFIVVGGDELLQARGEGKQLTAIAALFQTSPYAFAVLAGSDIQTPADFAGKVLGEPGGAIQNRIVYTALLNRYGIGLRDVEFKRLGFNTVENLQKKEVDVAGIYRIGTPYSFDQAGLAYRLILPEQHGFVVYGDSVITSQELIDENPDVVRRFLDATFRGWDYVFNHFDEAIDITLPYVTDTQYKSRAHEEFILEGSLPLMKTTGGQPLGAMNFITWRRLYFVMESSGLLETKFDITSAYTTQFLR